MGALSVVACISELVSGSRKCRETTDHNWEPANLVMEICKRLSFSLPQVVPDDPCSQKGCTETGFLVFQRLFVLHILTRRIRGAFTSNTYCRNNDSRIAPHDAFVIPGEHLAKSMPLPWAHLRQKNSTTPPNKNFGILLHGQCEESKTTNANPTPQRLPAPR